MIVERSMHPDWLSNAYLVGDRPGGTGVFVDSGAPLEPLLAAVESHRLTPTHLLVTHGHGDHTAGNEFAPAPLRVGDHRPALRSLPGGRAGNRGARNAGAQRGLALVPCQRRLFQRRHAFRRLGRRLGLELQRSAPLDHGHSARPSRHDADSARPQRRVERCGRVGAESVRTHLAPARPRRSRTLLGSRPGGEAGSLGSATTTAVTRPGCVSTRAGAIR